MAQYQLYVGRHLFHSRLNCILPLDVRWGIRRMAFHNWFGLLLACRPDRMGPLQIRLLWIACSPTLSIVLTEIETKQSLNGSELFPVGLRKLMLSIRVNLFHPSYRPISIRGELFHSRIFDNLLQLVVEMLENRYYRRRQFIRKKNQIKKCLN